MTDSGITKKDATLKQKGDGDADVTDSTYAVYGYERESKRWETGKDDKSRRTRFDSTTTSWSNGGAYVDFSIETAVADGLQVTTTCLLYPSDDS